MGLDNRHDKSGNDYVCSQLVILFTLRRSNKAYGVKVMKTKALVELSSEQLEQLDKDGYVLIEFGTGLERTKKYTLRKMKKA